MSHADAGSSARIYWITWAALLGITLIMLVIDNAAVSRPLLVAVLLAAMSVKAVLIAGNFMHLRHERSGLICTVVLGLFVMGFILFALMVPDAYRIHEMGAHR